MLISLTNIKALVNIIEKKRKVYKWTLRESAKWLEVDFHFFRRVSRNEIITFSADFLKKVAECFELDYEVLMLLGGLIEIDLPDDHECMIKLKNKYSNINCKNINHDYYITEEDFEELSRIIEKTREHFKEAPLDVEKSNVGRRAWWV